MAASDSTLARESLDGSLLALLALGACEAGWIVLGAPLSAVQYGSGAVILVGIATARPKRRGETR